MTTYTDPRPRDNWGRQTRNYARRHGRKDPIAMMIESLL